MSWAEIKRAINSNLAKPLDTYIGEVHASLTSLGNTIWGNVQHWTSTRASYIDHLYSQFANRGGYLDTNVSTRQSEANAVARYNNLYNRMTAMQPSLNGQGATAYSGSTTMNSEFVTAAKFIAPVSGLYKMVAVSGASSTGGIFLRPRYGYNDLGIDSYGGEGALYAKNAVNTSTYLTVNGSGGNPGGSDRIAMASWEAIGIHTTGTSENYFYCNAGEPVLIAWHAKLNRTSLSSIVITYQPR